MYYDAITELCNNNDNVYSAVSLWQGHCGSSLHLF